MNIKSLLYLWGPVLIWAGVIFFFSSLSTIPSAQKIWWDFLIKKLAHITEYAILYFLVVRASGNKRPRTLAFAFILCILYAASDEIHQSFTPGRHPGLIDVGFDSLGMTVSHLRLRRLI